MRLLCWLPLVLLLARVPSAAAASSVSIRITIAGDALSDGIDDRLFVKLWDGTTLFPLSGGVSVPTDTDQVSGSCSTTYVDNAWSGADDWLLLDDIDVSSLGASSTQSLGTIDSQLPET